MHTFEAVNLPGGLTLDAKAGVIAGAPQKAGAFDVVVEVSDQFGKTGRASYRLIVEE